MLIGSAAVSAIQPYLMMGFGFLPTNGHELMVGFGEWLMADRLCSFNHKKTQESQEMMGFGEWLMGVVDCGRETAETEFECVTSRNFFFLYDNPYFVVPERPLNWTVVAKCVESEVSMEKRESLLIVAHPDDEILWFSSVIPEVDKVIIVFGDLAEQPKLGELRAQAISELPFEVVFLGIREAGTYGLANWEKPVRTDFGLRLERGELAAAAAYESNFNVISDFLKPYLSSDMDVYTHNPWGEYGHEDHVQLYKIVEDLRRKVGFSVFVSCYYSRRSGDLAKVCMESECFDAVERRIDAGFASEVAAIYKKYKCWTWADDWDWGRSEYFLFRSRRDVQGSGFAELEGCHFLKRVPSSVSNRLPRDIGG